jgi:hypothetical protein
MSVENFIIHVFIFVDDFLKTIGKIRRSGPSPELSDAEVITIEIVGEFLGCGRGDKAIFDYMRQHWLAWFPDLNCRTTFARQCANLWKVKEMLYHQIVKIVLESTTARDITISDGLPLPTCHPKRVRKNNPLRFDGAFGYCAAKDKHYFGFKGHLLTNDDGLILNFAIAPANIDERDVLPEIVDKISGLLIADKGLISPSLKSELAKKGIDLQTPLRENMKDNRPKWLINWAMNVRRIIETVNGQLVERFNIQIIRAKDLWHFSSKVLRKILAHSFAFMIAGSLRFDEILG